MSEMRYHWYHPGPLDSPQSGCAMGVRKGFGTLRKPERLLGSRAGGGIRERSILRGKIRALGGGLSFKALSGHAPPPRARVQQSAYMGRFARAVAAFKGGDLNLLQRAAARATGRRVVGQGVLWLALPRTGWSLVGLRIANVTSDHKALLVRMKHKRTGRQVLFLVINCMSVSTGDEHAAAILARGLRLNPDVVMASECSDFRARLVDAKTA